MGIYIGNKLVSDNLAPEEVKEQNKKGVQKFWRGTQNEYDQLEPADDTLYIITDKIVAYTSQLCNRNLLDNWYFTNPVNQRGQIKYSGAVYGVDRWKMAAGATNAVVVENDGLKVTFNSVAYLAQIIENPAIFSGKTVTISALCGDVGNGLQLRIRANGSFVCNVACVTNGVASTTVTLPANLTTMQFELGSDSTAGYSAVIKAAKLELGSEQTLAHQENGVWVLNEIPNYSEQLLKCIQSTADGTDTYANKIIAYTSQLCNRNLLDNWYFAKPVNQRGVTSGTASWTEYFIDRWLGQCTYELTGNGLQLEADSYLCQRFDQPPIFPFTVSVKLSNGTVSSAVFTDYNGGISLPGYGGNGGFVGISPGNGYSYYLAFHNPSEAVEIVAAKLELGTQQTLAHQDENGNWVLNEVPDFGEQLAKCQRYYLPLNNYMRYPVTRINSSEIDFMIPTPATFRSSATLTGSCTVYSTTAAQTDFAITVACTASNAVAIRGTKSNHGLDGAGVYLATSGAALSADL